MSELVMAQQNLKRAQARLEAARVHVKSYRGIPYEHNVTNGKRVGKQLTYRGTRYNFS